MVRVMARRCAQLDVWATTTWLPRTSNQWADTLSKGYEGGELEAERSRLFDAASRMRVNWALYDCITEDVKKYGS